MSTEYCSKCGSLCDERGRCVKMDAEHVFMPPTYCPICGKAAAYGVLACLCENPDCVKTRRAVAPGAWLDKYIVQQREIQGDGHSAMIDAACEAEEKIGIEELDG